MQFCLKKTLRCFPVNFAKVLSTPRLMNTSGQLILSYWPNTANSITNSLRKFCVVICVTLPLLEEGKSFKLITN